MHVHMYVFVFVIPRYIKTKHLVASYIELDYSNLRFAKISGQKLFMFQTLGNDLCWLLHAIIIIP